MLRTIGTAIIIMTMQVSARQLVMSDTTPATMPPLHANTHTDTGYCQLLNTLHKMLLKKTQNESLQIMRPS